jgi:hypothetical protein
MEEDYTPPSRLKIAVVGTITFVSFTLLFACALHADGTLDERMHGHATFADALRFSSASMGLFLILFAAFFFCTIPILAGLVYVYCGPTICLGLCLQCFLLRADLRRLPE